MYPVKSRTERFVDLQIENAKHYSRNEQVDEHVDAVDVDLWWRKRNLINNKGRNGPRSAARFKPEVHPSSVTQM